MDSISSASRKQPAKLSTLARAANRSHERCEKAIRSALEHARHCGDTLIAAKKLVGHGQFETWIAQQCKFSPRMARRYMTIANGWKTLLDLSKRQHVAEMGLDCMTIREALRLLSAAVEGRAMSSATCGDCGASEGENHRHSCDKEHCPFCGGQLFSCDCRYEILGIDNSPGSWAYENGLTEAQAIQFEERLQAKGLVPFILYPHVCGRCGELWPAFFRVSDEEWQKYIPIRERKKILCRACFEQIKELIDNGTQHGGPQSDDSHSQDR